MKLGRLGARLVQRVDFELRPRFAFLRTAISRDLAGRLAAEDSAERKAVALRGSEWLARLLGLAKTRLLVLDYPDFVLENLALLSDEYDFLVADRALHRCDDLGDAAREIMRVLRPGGCFVVTTSCLDLRLAIKPDPRRFLPGLLARLFPDATSVAAGGGPMTGWVAGRKAAGAGPLAPTIERRGPKRPFYRFRPRRARFGVMAIVRNEAPYLLEWIAHYRVLGFSQITIYDNQSNDGTPRILGPLARAGVVDAVYWRDREDSQRRAYNHAVRRLRPHVEWCLFADLDEFLVLDAGMSLDDLLPTDPRISAVGIPWLMFGSAGQHNREAGLVIERFTMAAPTFHRLVKSLVRLRDARLMGIHIPKRIAGRVADVLGQPLNLDVPRTAPSPARLHHYFNRSWEEFICKRLRGDISNPSGTYPLEAFDRYGAGEVEVLDALALAPAVRAEAARLRHIVCPARSDS